MGFWSSQLKALAGLTCQVVVLEELDMVSTLVGKRVAKMVNKMVLSC